MDKVKLEKLKKSLDNKFLNDDMKDKIRKEIASMEAVSVKEVKKPVAVAKKVVAKAEPKAKVEVKAVAPKKPTTAKKTISGESPKTITLINRRKDYKKTLTKSPNVKYDLKKDAVRKALPMGKRTSKAGNVYYENRFNHADLGGTKGAYLKDGGEVSKISIRDIQWSNEENHKLGVWLLTRPDGINILAKSNNANDLKKLVMEYAKKRGSVANMKYNSEDFKEDSEADDGLSWVTFEDLWEEVKSLGKEKKFAKGGSISDKSTYVGKREIDSVKTVYGQTIKGDRLFDGNYVKGKVKKPTMSRTQFEEETYDFKNGGSMSSKSIDRDKMIELLENKYKIEFVRESEDWNGSKGYIWMSGENNDNLNGKKIFDYYNRSANYTFGVLKTFRTAIEKLGWRFEWNDAGTIMLYPNNFAKGGSISDKSTYVGKREIDSVRTVYGQTIKGNRLFDGNYVKGKVNKPTMSRTQFEEESYDYASGGSLNRRTKNAKALKIANFEDISFINLVKLLPTKTNQHDYKSDKVYGVVIISEIHNIKVLEFKTLTEAEKRFDDLVEAKSLKTKLLDLVTLKNNYLFGGRLKSALMRDRKNVNKSESWERSYSKPKAHRTGYLGKRDFANGGSVNFDTNSPKIYVADLEAYNNGRLVGSWLDLSDYSDADELEEAIQDLLTEWGVEEYAIHDTENIPSSMYSEYMGARDFEELYTMIDLANDKDLPLEVVQDIVSQFDESAVDEFYGKYDSAEDFAQSLVDDLGIDSFSNFESYLYVTDTDSRLLAQEMADNYVDDIIAEDDGERIIGEAELDLDEYQEADEDRREAMIEEAREIVYDAYYDEWYNGLKSDAYSFLVEEQGMYDAESFANANFAVIDYEKIARDLEDDYTFIHNDDEVYVFNIR